MSAMIRQLAIVVKKLANFITSMQLQMFTLELICASSPKGGDSSKIACKNLTNVHALLN